MSAFFARSHFSFRFLTAFGPTFIHLKATQWLSSGMRLPIKMRDILMVNRASLYVLIMLPTWGGLLHHTVEYSYCFVHFDMQIITCLLACECAQASGHKNWPNKITHTISVITAIISTYKKLLNEGGETISITTKIKARMNNTNTNTLFLDRDSAHWWTSKMCL